MSYLNEFKPAGWLIIVTLLQFVSIATGKDRPQQLNSLISQVGNLQQFLAAEYYNQTVDSQINSFLIIYGGYSINSTTSMRTFNSKLFIIDLQTLSLEIISPTFQPPPRHSPCGVIINQTLFIYGGYLQNGSLTNELWQFNLYTSQWTLLANSLSFTTCQAITITTNTPNDTLTIIGIQQSSGKIKAIEHNLLTLALNEQIPLQIKNTISLPTTTWENLTTSSFLRLQSPTNIPPYQKVPHPQGYFPLSKFCLLNVQQNLFRLVTDNGVFIMTRTTNPSYDVVFESQRNSLESDGLLYCRSLSTWQFLLSSLPSPSDSTLYELQVSYHNTATSTGGIIHPHSPNLHIQWIPPAKFFHPFLHDQALVIINQNLQLFWLEQQCEESLGNSNPHVSKCTFGLLSCHPQYTGPACTTPICPGSLHLYDLNDLAVVAIQCSNNGKCTQNGCQCNPNWTGSDCSIYQNKNCEGQLTSNFLISNCQCNQPTTGGNLCNVVFCYNDCSGKGRCGKDGKCICNEGYTGPDCSLLIITFELIG